MNTLKQSPVFVCYKNDPNRGKVPKNPKTGGNAQSNNPTTWGTYEQAIATVAKYQCDGVGFMFADGTGTCGIDIDNVVGNPEREALAKEIISLMDTYTEYSPSGNGYHIIIKFDPSKIPKVNRKLDPAYYMKNPQNGVECYMSGFTNRFFTYTGKTINDRNIEDRTEQLLIFLDKYMKKANPPTPTKVTGGFRNGHVPNDTQAIISIARKAKNSKNFLALFEHGDTSKHNGDDSSADMALCCMLAFYCGENPSLIDTIFRQSKLYRDKWEREDYRIRTIEKAISLQNGKFYNRTKPKRNPSRPKNKSPSNKAARYNGANYLNPFETPESKQRYEMNDIGASNLYADTYRNISRNVPESKMWYVYDGCVWRPDEGNVRVAQQAKDLTYYMFDCREYINDNDQLLEAWIKFASGRMRKKNRDIMLEDAATVFPVSLNDFDTDPYLLNVQNGTLDLRTFTLLPHNPNDFLSKIANVIYDPTARCERWELFVQEIMQNDTDKAQFLQKALGYALTGDTTKDCFFILFGNTTRNGKGTTAETILYLMGDYSKTAQPETIAQKQSANGSAPSEDIARLRGARFVNMSEPDKGLKLNSALVKQMTGGDTITARFLHQNSFQYKPEYKLFISTNHLPKVNDDSIFASGRVKLIPFTRHFTETEQDKRLKELFKQPDNLSGILNWLIEGLKLMREEGLELPKTAEKAISQYREESDTVGLFINDNLAEAKKYKTRMKEIYNFYVLWCKENGNNPLNSRNLTSELRRKGMTVKPSTGNQNYLFDYELPEGSAPEPVDEYDELTDEEIKLRKEAAKLREEALNRLVIVIPDNEPKLTLDDFDII